MTLIHKKGFLLDIILKSTGFGGSREYFKTDGTLQTYYPTSERSVAALRLQLGKMWNWNDNDPDYSYEKFYLGGSTSMRAWDVLRFKVKDGVPSGDIIRLMANLESRIDLYKSIGLTFFIDGGILTNEIASITYQNMSWNLGLGFTIKTPLGPFRIDYAQRMKESNISRIQLGVQSLF